MTPAPLNREQSDRVRAVVVKLYDGDYTERAWVAATMSAGTWDAIGTDDWNEWKKQALDLVLADWHEYEVREVWLDVPQDKLEALFSDEAIDVEVQP